MVGCYLYTLNKSIWCIFCMHTKHTLCLLRWLEIEKNKETRRRRRKNIMWIHMWVLVFACSSVLCVYKCLVDTHPFCSYAGLLPYISDGFFFVFLFCFSSVLSSSMIIIFFLFALLLCLLLLVIFFFVRFAIALLLGEWPTNQQKRSKKKIPKMVLFFNTNFSTVWRRQQTLNWISYAHVRTEHRQKVLKPETVNVFVCWTKICLLYVCLMVYYLLVWYTVR